MISRLVMLLCGIGLLGGTSACAPLLIGGGAAGGAIVLHERRTTGTLWEDQTIEWKAATAFAKDPQLSDPERANVSVTSYNKTVLLSGEATTQELRQHAAEIVRYIPEVKQVYNELVIAPPGSPTDRAADAAVTTQVKASLLQIDLPGFDPTRIKVVTSAGTVYLLGLVTPAEADAVVNQAKYVSGVRQVVKLFEYIRS
ncbi:MAG: BON domain-containing protein [Candidatus Competibacteraceae bacterium]